MKSLSSLSSPDAGTVISIVMLILFPVLRSHWPLPLYLGGPIINLSGYSWCGCRQDFSLVRMKWLSSYRLHPPVTPTSLGFLQGRGLPLDSCTPPVLMFVKLSRAKTNSGLCLLAMELSISSGTCAAKESLKWQFCLPAKTGQLARKERCWQTAEVAVEFWKLCYVAELSCKGSVTVRVGWQFASKEQGDRRDNLGYPWIQQWHGLSQLAVEIRDWRCQDPGAVPLLMTSRLLTLMPSPRAYMQSMEGRDWKMLQLFVMGGAGSLPGLISAFPSWCFPVVSDWRIKCPVQQITCSLA